MAERAKKQETEPRTFVKQVGSETLTRHVTSAQSEVQAVFDGYREQTPAKPSGSASSAARPSSGAGSSPS